NNSNGAGEFFIAGTTGTSAINRSLLKFDIAGSIPPGAVIMNVRLQLHVSLTNSHVGAVDMELHKVTSDWGEGTSNAGAQAGNGVSATTNDATWVNNFYPSSVWNVAGGDFNSAVSAVQTVDTTGFYFWNSFGMTKDVQGWLTNPSSNFGWMLK